MPEYVPVSFSALPLVSSVSPSDQTLVVQAGVAKRAPFSALPTAPAGPPGPPGSQIITGSAPPTTSLGNSGDIYIQINTGDVYKKTGNTWNLIGNIKGPPGQPGQQGPAGQPGTNPEILFGTEDPNNGIGNNGDLYINTNTGQLFSKVNNNWVFRIFLKGERGTQIYSGNNPPAEYLGLNGDYYINTTNGNLFRKQNGDWTLIYNLGSTSSGSSGSNIYFLQGVPSNADGNDGDVAIDVGSSQYSGLIRYKYLGNWGYDTNQPKVMTNRNKRLFWGLPTSEEQRWDFDEQHHQIFDLRPGTTEFYIRFSQNDKFYYEILGWEQQLRIRIDRQANSNFTLTYRTINGTATLNSANQPSNVIGLDFNITLGRGERMIFYNSGPFYTDQHYLIDTFRPSLSVPQSFGSMYFWIYEDE
jgi:hypothetical protein